MTKRKWTKLGGGLGVKTAQGASFAGYVVFNGRGKGGERPGWETGCGWGYVLGEGN